MRIRTKGWDEVIARYEELVQNGWKIEPMQALAEYLAGSAYAQGIFPSVALGLYPATSVIELWLGRVENFERLNNTLAIKLHPSRGTFTFTYFQREDDYRPWTRECAIAEWQPVLQRILQKRLRWFHDAPTTQQPPIRRGVTAWLDSCVRCKGHPCPLSLTNIQYCLPRFESF